ncbi:MAG: hypothetical protein IE916_00595 [Epsilonproteobacteria bacterium]|nr:hypothetical protein [Campylobacterota bacterium]
MKIGSTILAFSILSVFVFSGCSSRPLSLPDEKKEVINPEHEAILESYEKDIEDFDDFRRDIVETIDTSLSSINQETKVAYGEASSINRFSNIVKDYKRSNQ